MKKIGRTLMLAVTLCASLLATSVVSAVSYEAGVSYQRINQNLFSTIEFPMDAATVQATAWSDIGFGIRAMIGRSTETANHLYVKGLHYSNKINAIYSAMIMYRHSFGEFTAEFGLGKTDYKSTWKVNGIKPDWSDGTDSDWSYHASIKYPINDDVDLSFGYSDLYRKNKSGYGREETRSFSAGFAYNF